ncbi:hypothetical protein HHI36_019976, partial [Cryptolaemus montrouzieri]
RSSKITTNYTVNKIFTLDEEKVVSNYFQTMANLHHGLNAKCAIKLAYDLALANSKKIPPS